MICVELDVKPYSQLVPCRGL